MHLIEGENRNQLSLFPQTLEDYVPKNNIARLIEEFVYTLNLQKLGFKKTVPALTGRPAYDPKILLGLYIYGYYYRIRSSRWLERETYRNLEVIWLVQGLHPDHKTISNFRKDNCDVLKKVFSQFVSCCQDIGLIKGELIGIDGSKFRAVNSKKRNFNDKALEDKIKHIEMNIEIYLKQLDSNDDKVKDNIELTADEIEKKIDELRKRKKDYEDYRTTLKESGQSQLSLTDPDSCRMKDKQKTDVCYNVQTAVDKENKLIVTFEVTNEINDQNLLSKVALSAKESLGANKFEVVADKGYFNYQEIEKCLNEGITPYIPEPVNQGAVKDGVPQVKYYKSQFSYNAQENAYICPCGNKLNFTKKRRLNDKIYSVYCCKECTECPEQSRCTRSKEGRTITRWENEEILEDMRKRLSANKDMMKNRQCLCEHPFGTVKRGMSQGYFLMKSLARTTGEAAITFTVYNLKRVINILGLEKLIDKFRDISGRDLMFQGINMPN